MDWDDDEAGQNDNVDLETLGGEHNDEERKDTRPKAPSVRKSWQQNFNCMQKHDGLDRDSNPNRQTIDVLQQMLNYYERTKDHWRILAYRKAIAQLKRQEKKITTKEEAFAIPFVGERLAEKIEEIAWTNNLRRLENAKLEPNDAAFQLFANIYGVGAVQASAFIDQGFRSLHDLREKAHLTKNQRVGIDHYEDFLARVPRAEVEKHGDIVRKAIKEHDEGIHVIIGGSYRRGAADSGDVDFIITQPDTIIPRMFKQGYLQISLAASSTIRGSKWHGAACLPGSSIWRRVDFLLVPWEEMGAALIYFTGNDLFNRSIRLLASMKGMRLNQRGLWRDVLRGRNRERITQGNLVESRSERRISEILGVPYWRPEDRNC